jgi:hypothetical protein
MAQIMLLELNFLFLRRRLKLHWDDGWMTSTKERFFDIESAARAESIGYLTSLGKSPDDYKRQLTDAAADATHRASAGLFEGPGLLHRLFSAAHHFVPKSDLRKQMANDLRSNMIVKPILKRFKQSGKIGLRAAARHT